VSKIAWRHEDPWYRLLFPYIQAFIAFCHATNILILVWANQHTYFENLIKSNKHFRNKCLMATLICILKGNQEETLSITRSTIFYFETKKTNFFEYGTISVTHWRFMQIPSEIGKNIFVKQTNSRIVYLTCNKVSFLLIELFFTSKLNKMEKTMKDFTDNMSFSPTTKVFCKTFVYL